MDKRSIKTTESIRRHFFLLLKDKNITDITVSELCKKSGIHRKTFYAHYKNTAEILDEQFEEFLTDITHLYTETLVGAIGNFEVFFSYVDQYILAHLEEYQLLAKTSQYAIFINRVDEYYSKILFETFDKDFHIYRSVNKFTLYALLSGIVQLYTHWIKDSSQCPINYISATCIQLANAVFGLKETN